MTRFVRVLGAPQPLAVRLADAGILRPLASKLVNVEGPALPASRFKLITESLNERYALARRFQDLATIFIVTTIRRFVAPIDGLRNPIESEEEQSEAGERESGGDIVAVMAALLIASGARRLPYRRHSPHR